MPLGWLTVYFDVLNTNMQTELVQLLLQRKTDSSMQSNPTVIASYGFQLPNSRSIFDQRAKAQRPVRTVAIKLES